MMSAALRFGIFAVGAYLVAVALLAFFIWAAGGGEYWALFGLLMIPAELLFILPAPGPMQHWLIYSSPPVIIALGAIAWFIVGWVVGRIGMFYRDHS